MKFPAVFAIVCLWRATVNAHMFLTYPAPYRSTLNPNTPSGKVDYSMANPLKADGSDFPCKGYQADFGTPAGASVATWAAGGTYNFSVGGGASHNGGSCQVALSYDGGKTFTVIYSLIGGCPLSERFDFPVPSDAKTGAAMFAWAWFNNLGNREMYMNCASVTITEAASKKTEKVSFSSRPSLFVANVGNGCSTTEATDVVFPDPGPDVINTSKTPGQAKGTCNVVSGTGGNSSSSSTSSRSSGQGAQSQTVNSLFSVTTSSHSTLSASSGFITVTTPRFSASSAALGSSASLTDSGSSALPITITSSSDGASPTSSSSASPTASSFSALPAASGSSALSTTSGSSTSLSSSTGTSTISPSVPSTGILKQSTDGSCGNGVTCVGVAHGGCCSQFGWCGSSDLHCGAGCQPAFGDCHSAGGNSTANTSSSAGSSSSYPQSSNSFMTASSSYAPSSSSSAGSSSSSSQSFMTASGTYTPSSSSSAGSSNSYSQSSKSFITASSSYASNSSSSAGSSSSLAHSTKSSMTGSKGTSIPTTFITATTIPTTTRINTYVPITITDLSAPTLR